MAQTILDKVLSNEFSIDDLIEWIKLDKKNDNENFIAFNELSSREEFITYFLNYIHGNLFCAKTLETPQKNYKIEPNKSKNSRRSLFQNSKPTDESLNKSKRVSSTPKHSKSTLNDSFQEYSPIRSKNTICLGDFLNSNQKNSSKKKTPIEKKSKRINPTSLNENKRDNVFKRTENSFNFNDSVIVENEGRSFFTDEIKNISINQNPIELRKVNPNVSIEIIPNPKLVRFKDEIDKINKLYIFLINRNFVLNVAGELYFLTSLLVEKCRCETDHPSNYFNNIHNVIYFVCHTIGSLDALESLDKLTLKYLSQSERLLTFAPELSERLRNLSDGKVETRVYVTNEKLNVCFISDTDNRSNFPSDASFFGFKKQRDLFYEILKIWEENHANSEWNFAGQLGRKIDSLLKIHTDSFNFVHLCRLFKDQLLSTCEKKISEETTDVNSTILTSLPIDRDKFNRLKTRLVTKQSSDGITHLPSFPGYQEFFKDFIIAASNSNFSRHLCDTLINDITELNEATFFKAENLDGCEVDQETKNSYVKCVKSLRVLAKFLGFVESYPYRSDHTLPDNLVDLQRNIRGKVRPSFDVLTILESAFVMSNLVITIPWLCKYLSMLDGVTLKLEYYGRVIDLLVPLYRSDLSNDLKYNVYFLKYSIGWFFDQDHFPTERFFRKIGMKSIKSGNNGIDNVAIIDRDILYVFCPFLNELRKLLSNKVARHERNTARHITPLTAVNDVTESKKIENQLEEAFFNGHPASMKKTVDFVAERITSSCIKHVCYTIVPEFKETMREQLRDVEDAAKLTQIHFEKLRIECRKGYEQIIDENIPKAIESLLPIDTLGQVSDVCASVCERLCREKVNWWIGAHVTPAMIKKEIEGEIKRERGEIKVSSVLPPGGADRPHDDRTLSPAHALNEIQKNVCSLLKGGQFDTIGSLLEDVNDTLTKRNDVSDHMEQMICIQLVELSLLLIAHNPGAIDTDKFISIWSSHRVPELFDSILCPRNVMLITQAGTRAGFAWETFGKFCARLVEEGLIKRDDFENQCTSLFRHDHDEVILKLLTKFLSSFVSNYKYTQNGEEDKFTFLLDWMADYCVDL